MEGGFNPSVRRVGTLHWNRGFMIGAGAFLYAYHPLTGLVCCRFFFTGCWLLSGCFCSFLNLCSAPVLAVGRTFNPQRPASVGILRSWAWQSLHKACVRCLRTLPQIFVNSRRNADICHNLSICGARKPSESHATASMFNGWELSSPVLVKAYISANWKRENH